MQLALLFVFCLTVIYGGLCDISRFKIPNSVSYGLVLLFAVFALATWPKIPLIGHLVVFAVVFAICLAFWQFKFIGGGDVKFISAIALWMGPANALPFSILLTLTSVLFLLILRGLRFWNPYFQSSNYPQFIKTLLQKSDSTIPYGVPSAIAAIIVAVPWISALA